MSLKGSTSGKGNKLIVRAIDVGYGNTKFVDQHDHGSDIVCSLFPSVAPQTSAGPELSGGVIQRLNTVTAFYPPDCPSLPLSLTTVTRVAAQPEAADHLLPF